MATKSLLEYIVKYNRNPYQKEIDDVMATIFYGAYETNWEKRYKRTADGCAVYEHTFKPDY